MFHEVLRTREALIDHFAYNNEYNTTDKKWQRFFTSITMPQL